MIDLTDDIPATARSVGIFGGTFDPVHMGHLLLAEYARDEMRLDIILFLPAYIPPHKRDGRAISAAGCRLEMLRLATESNPGFAVSAHEIECEGVSYTVDTLQRMREAWPQVKLTMLIGGDSARDFRSWRQPEQIARLARIGVWERPDIPLPPELLPGVGYHRIDSPLIEISSTEIRESAREGRSIRYRTPDPVIQYINQHGLYR
ncbi:MAG: nicotinate-nicotinamide nucleotide adenylyltransferase [Chlorobi bacterium]|nr:nicotinate-nicotinamide nucleotide adenylyltransferase [Chlorobiota bacterium]